MNYVPIRIRLEELQEKSRKRRKMKRYIPERIYHKIRNYVTSRKLIRKQNKERSKKGWAESDAWEWYIWHAKITSESLNYLAETVHGWPGEWWGTYEEWQCFINDIAGAYKNVLELENYYPMTENKYDWEKIKKANNGMMERLLLANVKMSEMYLHLWD